MGRVDAVDTGSGHGDGAGLACRGAFQGPLVGRGVDAFGQAAGDDDAAPRQGFGQGLGVAQSFVAGASAAHDGHGSGLQGGQRAASVDQQGRIRQIQQRSRVAGIVQCQDMAVIARVQPGQGRLDVLLAHRVVGQQGAGRFVTAHQGAHGGVGGLQDGFRRAQPAKQQLAGDSADARRVDQPQPGGQGFVVGGGGLGNVRQGAHRGTGKGGRSRRYCQSPRASASAGWMMRPHRFP